MMTYEEFRADIDGILAMDDIEFRKKVQFYQKRTEWMKSTIITLGVENFRNSGKNNLSRYLEFTFDLCDGLALFPDPTFYPTLEALGVSRRVTKWFIGIAAINKQFYEISQKDFTVVRHYVLEFIIHFLHSKIVADILTEYEKLPITLKPGEGSIYQVIQNIFRRLEYQEENHSEQVSNLDRYMHELLKGFEEVIEDPKNVKKYFRNGYVGKTEKYYLNLMIEGFIPIPEMSRPAFIGALSGLLKLLLKDNKKLLDEKEFAKGDALYGNNYNRYLANRYDKIAGHEIIFKLDR